MPKRLTPITLTVEDRQKLEELTTKGSTTPRIYKRARILLLSDTHNSESLSLEETMRHCDVSRATVFNVREDFRERGLEALYEKPRSGRPSIFDGSTRAEITALACSQAPQGFARWSLRMLANRYVELYPEESISYVQVGKILKKRVETTLETPMGN